MVRVGYARFKFALFIPFFCVGYLNAVLCGIWTIHSVVTYFSLFQRHYRNIVLLQVLLSSRGDYLLVEWVLRTRPGTKVVGQTNRKLFLSEIR